MNTITRKIALATNILQKSPDWLNYYLDYIRKPGTIWKFSVDGLRFVLRSHSVDKWIVAENLVLDSYGLSHLKDTDFDQVFDVGANIGGFSVNAARHFKHARITAFEPNKKNLVLCKANIRLNGFEDRIKLIESAVSVSTRPTIRLYRGADYGSNSTYVQSSDYEDVKNFNLLTIAKRVSKKSLLKIDIEGGEIDIFTPKNVSFLKKFKMIILEYHHFLNTHNKDAFDAFLKQHGFTFIQDELIYIIRPQ